ncbi:MAG: VOC family protein [Rubrivivax sp.]|nr:VOC family protein [Rubrivivax sp.]
MDAAKTHGAFSWSELMTPDPQAAVAFYSQLFGWGSKDMDMGTGAYHVQSVGEQMVAGIMGMPPNAPPGMPPTWGVYVTVDNVDDTVAKCAELGGKVCLAPMEIPGVGRMAVIQDPQGATLNIMTYSNG